MDKHNRKITFRSMDDIEKNFFPKYYKEKIRKQQKEDIFRDFHMDETVEIEKYLKKELKKIN